jgi:hypothetical protein
MIDARGVTLLAIALFAGGCATAIRGTTQVVSVSSIPPGAECRFHRGDVELGTVAATPGRITLARNAADVVVVCRKEHHHAGKALLIAGNRESLFVESFRDRAPGTEDNKATAEAAGVVSGSVAVAGVAAGVPALIGAGLAGSTAAVALAPVAVVAAPIAMVVDASSGTYYAYPREVSVALLPDRFVDADTREAAITRALAALDQDDAALRSRFNATCGFTCRRAEPAFEAFLAARRAEVVQLRDTATLVAR